MTTSDTKTALLDFAEHAARARGFDGFSYADLAEAVGIRKASVHYHFPTKADLSLALIARYHNDLERACADIDAAHATGAARLMALVALYRAALQNGEILCLCVSLSTSVESLPPATVERINAFRTMMVAWIETVFERGRKDGTIAHVGAPQTEARATLALLEGAHLTARAQRDVTLFDRATEFLKERCGAG